ncbi:MAG TPA: GspE/PulE family protein [Candidatus Saccharimonadales bacterium]|nr:GspE/PulE family protein [Candidatus Saccharimonadales bacterium]
MQIADKELKKLLLASDKVKPVSLKDAEKFTEESGETLLQTVLKRKIISEKDLVKLYATSIDVPFVDLANVKLPKSTLTKIPERIARKYQVVLFGDKKGELDLAMADPEDFQAIDFIEKQLGHPVKVHAAASSDILALIDQYKGNIDSEITKAIHDSSEEESKDQEVSAKDLAEDAPIAKTVNIILEYGIKARASDVHIEPRENLVQVRYRIDGVLQESMTLPKPILNAVVSRIKILANLKIDEHRIPQDGRFKFSLGSKSVALRVSTLPVMDGEKVVMRLLDESTKAQTLEELGFEGRSLEVINRNLKKPHGMTLVTGPTGSGKSTTLYSILSLLNTPGINISTVEDPVEYRIQGVNQTQVNPKAGMTFANGLRALLRQDPNIIMVGEIRDKETADLAVQAALTGHIVLSTLHTNNAATTLPRLLDMGIEPFLIASTVNTVIGQRLVRRLCNVCRVQYLPSAEEMTDIRKTFQVDQALAAAVLPQAAPAAPEPKPATVEPAKAGMNERVVKPLHKITKDDSILDKITTDPNIINRPSDVNKPAAVAQAAPKIDPKTLSKDQFILFKPGPGCDQCGPTGYNGRIGIYEVLEIDAIVQKMIVTRATSEDIQTAGIKAGMKTMQQDGFTKAVRGLTTIEEILRVTKE